MPKRLYLPQERAHDGVRVTYTKSRRVLDFFVWYEGVGGECGELTLGEFLNGLGITVKDCERALAESDRIYGEGRNV